MAKKTKAKQVSAPAPKPQAAPSAPTTTTTVRTTTAPNDGFFLNSANWLLSRLPWFQDRYETWTKTRRIIVAYLLYIVLLPIIPIVIAIVMYIHDPEGFKKSKALPILGAIIVAQLGAFGIIATQPSKVTPPTQSTTQSTTPATKKSATPVDNSDTQDPATASEAKKSVATKTTSEPTKGRKFENCDAAFKAGVFNIPKSDPSYDSSLDRDSDGIACEK